MAALGHRQKYPPPIHQFRGTRLKKALKASARGLLCANCSPEQSMMELQPTLHRQVHVHAHTHVANNHHLPCQCHAFGMFNMFPILGDHVTLSHFFQWLIIQNPLVLSDMENEALQLLDNFRKVLFISNLLPHTLCFPPLPFHSMN